jgi:two-component system response regulator YesN
MYSVLIVDDDAAFRTHIKSLMNWEEEGFAVASEARNGKEAIEIIDISKPDIIITDISMPLINGIELIDYVAEYKKDIAVIAVSAYNDFDYVRSSLKNGARDYLLKNRLDSGELLAVLKSAAERLPNKSGSKDITDNSGKAGSLQEFLLLLLSGCAGGRSEIRESLRRLNLELLSDDIILDVADLDNANLINELSENEYYRLLYSIGSIMQECVTTNSGVLVTVIGRSRILAVIPAAGKNIRAYRNSYRKLLINMQENVKRFLDETVSFGVSDVCHDIMQLPDRYEQAVNFIHNGRFQGKTEFIEEAASEAEEIRIITLDNADE